MAALVVLGGGLVSNSLVHAQDDSAYAPPAPATNPGSDDQNPPAPADGPQPAPNNGQDQPSGPETNGADNGAANFQTFYDGLASQGNWIQTDDYGYVWQPNVNDADWAPYTDGHWVYTDDGWTWASDEPWGWATYHYGRWVNLDGTGWVWVPGYTWAPAWVSWRYGDGYVGWAPLPPDSFAGIDYFGDGYNADFGFHIGGDCDGFYGIGPALYIFLPIGCVCYHDYHHWYHPRAGNFTLINRTTNVTNINVTRGGPASGGATFRHVTTGGPGIGTIDAASPQPVPRASLVRSGRPGPATLNGNRLAVYAPRINPAAVNARPGTIAATLGPATINRGADITRMPAVNSRLGPGSATEEQIAAAHEAAANSPASAKVLTDPSTVRPILAGGRLATLKPAGLAAGANPTAGNNYTYKPAPVYNSAGRNAVFGPVRAPGAAANEGETASEREARETQQRLYNPTPVYAPRNNNPPAGNGAEQHNTYTTHQNPVYSPEPARAPSSGGGYESGNRGYGGGGGGGYEGGGNRGSSGGGGSSGGSHGGFNNGAYNNNGGGSGGGNSGGVRGH
jgi:hypothetical protein